jgi:DNA processing protein
MRPVAPRLGSLDRDALDARAIGDLEAARSAGAELVGPGDAGWPVECFGPLEWVRPFEQCAHAAVPLALYRRGETWPVSPRGAVTVVGSRASTPYGVRAAGEIAAGAVTDGYTVVSGAAFGIDASAHRGALHAGGAGAAPTGGVTVCVLACGIDRAYPAAHRALIDAIADSGAVVSEYPPGSAPARHRFLVRNRLIAALGEATVVVEAGRRSGSLNTATTAADVGRQVVAVPGPVTSAMSMGCHDLIRDGRAALCTGWSDLRGLVGPLQAPPDPHRPGDRPTDGLDLVAARVHEALPASGAVTVDALAVEAALPVSDVVGALGVLALEGLAHRRDGLWRRT